MEIAGTCCNLANIAKDNGDLAKACQYWEKSKTLYDGIGLTHLSAQVQGYMKTANCEDQIRF